MRVNTGLMVDGLMEDGLMVDGVIEDGLLVVRNAKCFVTGAPFEELSSSF